MPIRLKISQTGLLNTVAATERLPRDITRFRRRALQQTGFYLSTNLREYLENKKIEQDLALVTEKFRKKFRKKSKWVKRRKQHPGAVAWLGKFSRYRVDRQGLELQVDFGRKKRGQPGRRDPRLAPIVENIQEGYSITVTKRMRKLFAATRRKRPKLQEPGEDFFPLSKNTRKIVVPGRPVIDPFFDEHGRQAQRVFEIRFLEQIRRFNRGI